jgi:hypothetical protein
MMYRDMALIITNLVLWRKCISFLQEKCKALKSIIKILNRFTQHLPPEISPASKIHQPVLKYKAPEASIVPMPEFHIHATPPRPNI